MPRMSFCSSVSVKSTTYPAPCRWSRPCRDPRSPARLIRQSTTLIRLYPSDGCVKHLPEEGSCGQIEPGADGQKGEDQEPQLVWVHRGTAGRHRAAAETAPHGHTVGKVDSGLAVLVVVVSIVGIIGALVAFVGSGRLYDQVGKGAFSIDDAAEGPPPDTPASRAEAETEIRQLVEAKSARRVARGEEPLDVDAEVAALTRSRSPGVDEALRE